MRQQSAEFLNWRDLLSNSRVHITCCPRLCMSTFFAHAQIPGSIEVTYKLYNMGGTKLTLFKSKLQ